MKTRRIDPGRASGCLGPSGFTLIELLVVIAILGVLLALILSALSQAKDKAKNIQCVNNQRQITMGYKIAVDVDGEGRLGADSVADWFADHVGLPQEGWICPNAPVKSTTDPRLVVGSVTGGTVNSAWTEAQWDWHNWWVLTRPQTRTSFPTVRSGSYFFNYWLMGSENVGGFDSFYPVGLTNFFETDSRIQPALTPVLCDGVYLVGLPMATDSPPDSLVYGHGSSTRGYMSFICMPRHGNRPGKAPLTWPSNKPMPGAVNVAFYDGHVEQVPLDNLWQLYWHANYQPPAKRPGLP